MSPDDITVRPARPRDTADIARIAAANGQEPEDSGRDARYVAHLASHGRLLVAQADGGRLAGFAATRRLRQLTFLCDLFVDPAIHGKGIGRLLLDHAFAGSAERATFSSQDPRALPLYARFGLAPRWPLLYLSGDEAAIARAVSGMARAESSTAQARAFFVRAGPAARAPRELWARRAGPADAAAAERALTGLDRGPDYLYWAGAPGGSGLIIGERDEVIAAGAASRSHLVRLTVRDPASAAPALLAALDVVTSVRVQLCLPGPHPALGALLGAGFRVDDFDHYMSTSEGLVSTHGVPSPGLA
jgi:GNAT superfamily N-acetyltransferase